jgi:hypothetical protein
VTEPYDPNPPAIAYWPDYPPPSSYYPTYSLSPPGPGYGSADPYARPPGTGPIETRPPAVQAAVVLGFVAGGLLALGGLSLLGWSVLVATIDTPGAGVAAHWFTVGGVANLISGGLSCIGATQLQNGKRSGSVFLTITAGIAAICAIAWASQGGDLAFLIVFGVPPLVMAPLSWLPSATRWTSETS